MSNRKYRQGKTGQKKYDVAMIRDFLEQLVWDYRLLKFENTHPDTECKELCETAFAYMFRRGNFGLVPAHSITPEGVSKQEEEDAIAIYRDLMAAHCDGVLEALQSLALAFETAFECIHAKGPTVQRIPASVFLEMNDEGSSYGQE